MHSIKAVIASFAVMAGVTSAFTSPKTSFSLTSNPGCVVFVNSECGIGCQDIAILDSKQTCDKIGKIVTQNACNGTVSVDLTKNQLNWAFFEEDECRVGCVLKNGTCTYTP